MNHKAQNNGRGKLDIVLSVNGDFEKAASPRNVHLLKTTALNPLHIFVTRSPNILCVYFKNDF